MGNHLNDLAKHRKEWRVMSMGNHLNDLAENRQEWREIVRDMSVNNC